MSEIPSSSGLGDGHVKISLIHVFCIALKPISGITAFGNPLSGIIKNHGLVGLCQNWVENPVKYLIKNSEVMSNISIL